MDTTRAARFLVAGAFVGIGLVGGAVGVMALEDSGRTPAPTTTTQEVAPVEIEVTTTTEAPKPELAGPLAAGFEDYTPGDELPTPPPAPTPEQPTVSTVPGPYGPIYPDGYSESTGPPPAPPAPPIRPADEN